MRRDKEHAALVKTIIEVVNTSGVGFAFRCDTGTRHEGGRAFVYGTPGAPDIIVIAAGGRFVGIEVKTGSGRAKPVQREFAWRVQQQGGACGVVRCVDDALRIIQGEA